MRNRASLLIVLLSYNTPLLAYSPLRPPCPSSPISPLPPSSFPPSSLPHLFLSHLPLRRPLHLFSPLLEHAQRQNTALARPTDAELCLAHLPHSDVSLFLCLLPVSLLFPSEQHLPLRPIVSSIPPVPCTFTVVSLLVHHTSGPPLTSINSLLA